MINKSIFFFSFRVDQDQETVLEEIELAKTLKDFEQILSHDQLSLSMKKGDVLEGDVLKKLLFLILFNFFNRFLFK